LRKPSKLPTVLIAVALASAVAYFAFFRHKPQPATPPAVPAVAAAAEKAAPAPKPAAAPVAEAPKPEIAKAEPKPEAPKKAAAPAPVPVSFTPPSRSVKTEVDELIADGKWREAWAKVSAAFSGPIGDAERTELGAQGIRINKELLQERADEKDVELYEIQQ